MSQIPSAKTWARSSFLYSALKFVKKNSESTDVSDVSCYLDGSDDACIHGLHNRGDVRGQENHVDILVQWDFDVSRAVVHHKRDLPICEAHLAIKPVHVFFEELSRHPRFFVAAVDNDIL